MTEDEARALFIRLLHGVAPEIDLDAIDTSGPIQDELNLDSMDFLNLLTALHDATGMDVPERDYPWLATVDGFVAYMAGTRP
ncbi:MAG TPA: phosphopantetheine-binding protein [Acidimicrobiales bacterium]|nr:phosphopantetheine-binding protein [Acidimicrobiales bacterium]